MKKVVLLGDSIRLIGYGKKVPELLGEDYTVWQPSDNCRFAQYTLRMLFDLRKELEGADIIHWNNGLWDACELFDDGSFTPLETYADTMLRIAGILKGYAKKVIFATTTPVDPANPHDHNEIIASYNSFIVPKLREMGIIVNDLYSVVYPHIAEYICEDHLHLSAAGIDACAAAVVKAIHSADEPLDRLDEFFDIFGEDYPSEAISTLKSYEKQLVQSPEAHELLKRQIVRYKLESTFELSELNANISSASKLCNIPERALLFIAYAEMSFTMRELYRKNGISDDIWHDSVRDLAFKNRETHNVYNEWGLFTDWFEGFLKLRLFSLGRLEYEVQMFNKSEHPIERSGITLIPGKTPAISIHIPSDGKLRIEAVIDSFKKAYEFFGKYHIDNKLIFQCSSWLLYPRMLEFMTPGSNLSRFIECFEILDFGTSSEFKDCWRLFGRSYSEGSAALPRDTTLRKQYAEWLDAGNLPGYGKGILIFDGENIIR